MQKTLLSMTSGALIFCEAIGFISMADTQSQNLAILALVVACCCNVLTGYVAISTSITARQPSLTSGVFCAAAAVFWCFVTLAISVALGSKLGIRLEPQSAYRLILAGVAASLGLVIWALRILIISNSSQSCVKPAADKSISGISFSS